VEPVFVSLEVHIPKQADEMIDVALLELVKLIDEQDDGAFKVATVLLKEAGELRPRPDGWDRLSEGELYAMGKTLRDEGLTRELRINDALHRQGADVELLSAAGT
jgi:hypothetical protein